MVSNTPRTSDNRARQSRNQGRKNPKKTSGSDYSNLSGTQGNKERDKMFLSTKELTEIVYPCPVCRAIFYHDFELEGHLKSHNTTDAENSDTESDWSDVRGKKHSGSRLVNSVVSNKDGNESDSEVNLGASTSSDTDARQGNIARCPMCPPDKPVFGNVTDLQLHLTETHNVQTKVVNLMDKKSADSSMSKYGGHYECPVCALLFSSSSDMYIHLNSAHVKHTKSLKTKGKNQSKVKADEANSGK